MSQILTYRFSYWCVISGIPRLCKIIDSLPVIQNLGAWGERTAICLTLMPVLGKMDTIFVDPHPITSPVHTPADPQEQYHMIWEYMMYIKSWICKTNRLLFFPSFVSLPASMKCQSWHSSDPTLLHHLLLPPPPSLSANPYIDSNNGNTIKKEKK